MSSDPHVDDPAPSGYRVLFELGRGGMGAAFLARAEGVGGFERLVVIKRIRPERVDAQSIARFLREARIAAAIHHANVVSAQNVGEDSDGPYIVLDYVDGASLEELLDRSALKQRAIPVEIMLRIALDALAGLEAVHQARDAQGTPLNALHRDVSLQNILIGVDGVSRLLDFGIARSDLGGVSTDQHYLVGKLPYLPPEYLRRETLLPSADVYGLGVTMWLALTGSDLWPQASEAQILRHILQDGVPPLSRDLQVAPEIVELVARACAAKRETRFQTAREMAAQIELLDRERGWAATHHEVSQWLAELSGVDLARRRERVAQLASEPVLPLVRSNGGATLKSAGQRTRAEAPFAHQQMGEHPPSVDVVPMRKPSRSVAVAIGVAAAALVAAVLLLRHVGTSVAVAPITSAPTRAEPPAASVPALAVEPPAPLAPSQPSASAAGSTFSPRSTLTRIGHSAAPKPSSKPVPQGVRPPDQISKHNPYRD